MRLQLLFILGPQAALASLLRVGNFDIGKIPCRRQQVFGQKACALARVGAERIAVAGLRRVHVPPRGRIALFQNLAHQLQRGQHDGAAALGVVEERLLVHFLGVVRMADEDQVHVLVLARQEQVQQREEALGQVLLAFVHGPRNVHQAEHDRARHRNGD
ncbi:hypothetical protein D3C72_965760 [compost metagenome]